MSKKFSVFTFILSAILVILLIFVLIRQVNDNSSITTIDFSSTGPIYYDDNVQYTEYLYYNGRLYGIASEPLEGEGIYKNRIGRKIGQVNTIGTSVSQSGDIGVVDHTSTFPFKPGDSIHKVNDISKKLILLIKTSEGYFYTKAIL